MPRRRIRQTQLNTCNDQAVVAVTALARGPVH